MNRLTNITIEYKKRNEKNKNQKKEMFEVFAELFLFRFNFT
jgi:hypothetical protein